MADALTILLVDDDPLMHRMLVPRLQQMGVPVSLVRSATSPDEALAALDTLSVPLAVVSDFNLKATRTGLDLLRVVRERRPDATRVLFSGYSLEQLGAGTDVVELFLEKPLHLDELLRPLERFLAARLASTHA